MKAKLFLDEVWMWVVIFVFAFVLGFSSRYGLDYLFPKHEPMPVLSADQAYRATEPNIERRHWRQIGSVISLAIENGQYETLITSQELVSGIKNTYGDYLVKMGYKLQYFNSEIGYPSIKIYWGR